MPSIMGLDVGSENPWRLTVRIVAELIAACLFYAICIVGPLWPIGRLYLLRSSGAALAADNITNPDAQRMFSRVALVLLAAAGLTMWDALHSGDIRSWIGTLLLLLQYLWVTIVVFEEAFKALFERLHERIAIPVATVLFVIALANGREDDEDDGPTEITQRSEVRATGGGYGAIVGIVCMALFAATMAIVVAIEFVRATWPHVASFN